MFNGDLWGNASNAYAKQSKYLSLSALNDTPVSKFGIGLSVLAFIILFAAATIISRKTLIAKHTTDIRDVHKVSTAVRLEIWDALKDNGIEISYPQRDIHIRTTAGLENIVKKPKK